MSDLGPSILPAEDSRTGKYQGYAQNQEDAKNLFRRYLAQWDAVDGNIDDFPRDPEGQRQLVRQAVDAMTQLQGSKEAGELVEGAKRKNTAYSRIQDHFWSDLELELMGWRILVRVPCYDD